MSEDNTLFGEEDASIEDQLVAAETAEESGDGGSTASKTAEDQSGSGVENAEAKPKGEGESGEQAATGDEATCTPAKPAEGEAGEEKPAETVPLARHLHERRGRQQAEARMAELEQERQTQREEMARLDERLKHIQEVTSKPAAEAPDPEDDPVGAMRYENQQLREQLEAQGRKIDERMKPIEDARQSQEQESEHESAIDQLIGDIQGYEAEFLNTQPDYHDAIEFLMDKQALQYQASGANPAKIEQMVERDALAMGNTALRNGRDPAEVAYNVAKINGYVKKAPNGEATQTAEEKLENIARGQEQSSSLSKSGGEGTIPLTLQALADMDDETFDKVPDRVWRKLAAAQD